VVELLVEFMAKGINKMISMTYKERTNDKYYIKTLSGFAKSTVDHRAECIKKFTKFKNVSTDKVLLVEYTGYPKFITNKIAEDDYWVICEDKFNVRLKRKKDKTARLVDEAGFMVWIMVKNEIDFNKLKTFGGIIFAKNIGQCRAIVATKTKKRAREILKISRGEFDNYWAESGNINEVKITHKNPEVVFYAPLDEPHKKYKELSNLVNQSGDNVTTLKGRINE